MCRVVVNYRGLKLMSRNVPKDTLTHRLVQLGIEPLTFQLIDDLLYLLSLEKAHDRMLREDLW